MHTEVKINNQSIFYEVIESELESEYVSLNEIINPKNKSKTFMMTFSLDFPQEGLSKECAKELWFIIRKQSILFKNKNSEHSEKNFVLRISYKYRGAEFECEFDDLLDTEMDTLHHVNTFSEIFPNTKEIRIVRDGPIIIRFRRASQNNSYGNRIRQFINYFR